MIKLVSPRTGVKHYGISNGFLFGPVDMSGNKTPMELITEFRTGHDVLNQGGGIYGEKAVGNNQGFGTFEYAPYLMNVVSEPSFGGGWSVPDRIIVPHYTWGTMLWYEASSGICGQVGYGLTTWNDTYYYHGAALQVESNVWEFYLCASADGHSVGWSGITRLSDFGWYYDTGSCTVVSTNLVNVPSDTGINWQQRLDAWTVINFCKTYAGTPGAPVGTTLRIFEPYHGNVAPLSPRAVKRFVDDTIWRSGMEGKPFKLKPWGDLAMEASEKVNASSVNMLEFLRDIRNPKALIPKLAKLRDIKGMADTYLTVYYGILPTIDDIQSIVAAFRRRAPYLDKNGFSVFTSMSSESTQVADKTTTCEQRLKLAIDDEDSAFQDLIGRLESIGVFPTFNNVWELLPYSFVVDWLVDVGDFLDRIDTRMRLARLNIRYVTCSTKWTTDFTVERTPDFPYLATLQFREYHRWTADHCPTPDLSLHSSFQDFDHWLESGALILQRRK